MKNRWLVTGSFSPITIGHLDIILRASSLVDELVVGVFDNEEKSYQLSINERLELVQLACSRLDNVEVIYSGGLVVDYAKEHNISALVRGIRDEKDYLYEAEMARYNYSVGGIETVFIRAMDELVNVASSSLVHLEQSQYNQVLPDCIVARYIEMTK